MDCAFESIFKYVYLILTLDSIPSIWPSTPFCLSWTWKYETLVNDSEDDVDDQPTTLSWVFGDGDDDGDDDGDNNDDNLPLFGDRFSGKDLVAQFVLFATLHPGDDGRDDDGDGDGINQCWWWRWGWW